MCPPDVAFSHFKSLAHLAGGFPLMLCFHEPQKSAKPEFGNKIVLMETAPVGKTSEIWLQRFRPS